MNILTGWSIGYQFSLNHNKEREIAKGSNYYLAALPQAFQLSLACNFYNVIADQTLTGATKNWTCRSLSIASFAAIPFSLFAACVKQGNYQWLANKWNTSPYTPFSIPRNLSSRSVKIWSQISTHSGKAAHVAVIGASIGLMYIGIPALGGAMLAALTFNYVDSKGYLPRKVSLFAERYFPTVTTIGLIFVGAGMTRLTSAVQLPLLLSPTLFQKAQHKVDYLYRRFMSPDSMHQSLENIEKPVVKPNISSYEKIREILHDYSYNYVINPAFLSKPINDLSKYPVDLKFEKLLPLFDSVNWQEKYFLILPKLADDDRFLTYLRKNFPTIQEDDIKGQKSEVDRLIGQLALRKGITKEKLAADWTRGELAKLTRVLKGDKRVKGNQTDLDEGIYYTSKILPFLESVQTKNRMTFENTLLKIAVEAGGYCARGIKRATGELTTDVLDENLTVSDFDSLQDFERKVQMAMQQERMMIIQEVYSEIKKMIPERVGADVHGFDIYRLFLTMGFYPMTEYEREQFGLQHQFLWTGFYEPIKDQMVRQFQQSIPEVMNQVGKVRLGTYMQTWIGSLDLTDDQKNAIEDHWTNSSLSAERDFTRLLLVKMGVLIKR